MGQAFLAKALQGIAQVESAGSNPSGYVHPKAIQVMAEKGYDLTAARSEGLEGYLAQKPSAVITVCSNARDDCPCMQKVTTCHHWEFEDPAEVVGDEEDILRTFRKVRDQIERVFLSRLDRLLCFSE